MGTSSHHNDSDRSLSGSAHELVLCGIRDTVLMPEVPHSQSQSNLAHLPSRYGDVKFQNINNIILISRNLQHLFQIP